MVLVFIALGSTLTASGAFRPQAGRFGGHAGGVDGAWILQRLHPFAQDVGSVVSPAACCFAVWEGYGSLPDSVRGLPDLAVPQRRMLVREGPLDSVVESVFEPPWGYQSPNLWWPADQAWCVASEIDFNTTYVGGARACIADVLAAPGIEALATVVEAPIDFTSDEVNPRPR
jgi:hypothetical protein